MRQGSRTEDRLRFVAGEELLRGGAVNPSVARVGDTVRRTPSAATPAVHDLLHHLETKGFDGKSREMLSFIEGHVSLDGEWPEVLHRDEGLVAVVELIARFHDAVADYVPDPPLAPGEIMCHGDPGPWNIVWRHDDRCRAMGFTEIPDRLRRLRLVCNT